ncbi:hypothetical protein [Paenibacillus sp. YYML68]|uniref:glycoside hydrolase family 78 protein n=1 Tax=Paenibacillus sp. YYML68 TaxID=2909250 RepID=UPI0024905795|nr:hypothetical protein [Paenibacillus sp. YYML68]
MSLKFNYNNFSDVASAGLTFRRQDHRNMYRMEVTPKVARIVKVVNGERTVLQEVANSLSYRVYYDVKVKMNGTRLRGYVGGVPLLDVTDSAFASGQVGIYSEVPYSVLKSFTISTYLGTSSQLQNIGVVGTALRYLKQYTDLENDPPIDSLTKWTYSHTEPNKFLDAGDGYSGLSSMHGQTVTSPHAVLDKVGTYKIDYQLPDDPAPPGYKYSNDLFASYRKYSDLSTTYVTIHRRPISEFTLAVRADKTIAWTDVSRDPDRWLSATNYSTESTGINYRTTRGITEYQRNYTTPSGMTVEGQLTRPGESGWYTVRQAVKDEYGVWSEWYEVPIWVEPAPNNPPAVTLTYPTGTLVNPTPVSLKPTIRWNQSDPDAGTTFSTFNLEIKDESGGCVECKTDQPMNTTNGSWAWTMDGSLTMGRKYQVQVQVKDDGNLASPWSGIGWMVTNSPPTAYMQQPSGTQANPTVFNTTRPQLLFVQADPDPGTTFMYMQLQVRNEANTVMHQDSGQICQAASGGACVGTTSTTMSYTFGPELPAGQKLRVRVKTWDQHGSESDWSPDAWMLINRPPTGQLQIPSPIYEHDSPQFTVTVSDPDGGKLRVVVEKSVGGKPYARLKEWTAVDSGSTLSFTDGPLPEGPAVLRLQVTDEHGSVFEQSYSYVVLPLVLTGAVHHTPDWESYRQSWNARFPQLERAYSDFWAGEAFVLMADVTNTGSSSTTKPLAVTAELLSTGEEVELSRSAHTAATFEGLLLNTDHTKVLEQGRQTFRFTVTWSNGYVQAYDVPITIRDHIFDVIVNQLRH